MREHPRARGHRSVVRRASARAIGTSILLGLSALVLAACADAGQDDLVTVFARELPPADAPSEASSAVAAHGSGAVADVIDPGARLAEGQPVRIHGLRTEGGRLLLTLALTERAAGAQSRGDAPGEAPGPDPSPAASPEPADAGASDAGDPDAGASDAGEPDAEDLADPTGGAFELPTSEDVTVTSAEVAGRGPHAVANAVDAVRDADGDGTWQVTVVGGEIVALTAH